MALSQNEKRLLEAISRSPASAGELSARLSLSRETLLGSAESLLLQKFALRQDVQCVEISYTPEGILCQQKGLPEVRLLKLVANSSVQINSLASELRNFGIAIAKKNAWVEMSGGFLKLSPLGLQVLEGKKYPLLPADPGDLKNAGEDILSSFEKRGLINKKTKLADATLTITEEGKKALALFEGSKGAVGPIERQMLLSGSWKGKEISKYDLSAKPQEKLAARRHPISRLRQKISNIFIEMGFEEMEGPLAESAFWNFDSLFQPQDHPARDLADTFYIDEHSPLPPPALVKRVSAAHKKGWLCQWSEQEAMQTVLRTHTTAVSARTLFENAQNPAPKKYFSIGKVFRNEATDYKHLAEFFQVEGIIAWNGATFAHLLGTLKEFYLRLGFEKIRFRPSYFPYTEPSLEVEVFHPGKNEWLELGGAGVFRPEVSIPICNKFPVLAWGLSLERPLMLASKTEDIRTLYRNDLSWLRNFKIPQS